MIYIYIFNTLFCHITDNYGCHDLLELKTCLYEHGTMRIFRRMMKSYFFSICEDTRCRQTTRYSHYARQTRN